MNFGQLCFHTRVALQDLKVARVLETQIANALNEAKDEVCKIIRQGREDWFLTTTTGTISTATAPNYSSISLPSDFSELKEILITQSGYEHISFKYMDQSDPRFKDALISGGSILSGQGGFYIDLIGISTMIFAPGFDTALPYKLSYIQTVPDMTKRSDTLTQIPAEHHRILISWAVCEILRSLGDPRLAAYEEKLGYQKDSLVNAVGATDIREPRFVQGFLETYEGW